MADHVFNVLFLCTRNSARSILAESILNREGAGRFKGFSAGSHPKGQIHPYALDLLRKMNHPTRRPPFQELGRIRDAERAGAGFRLHRLRQRRQRESARSGRADAMSAHWGVPDPAAAEGTEAERRLAFAEAYRMLSNRISIFANLPLRALDRLGAAGAAERDRAKSAPHRLNRHAP